MGDFGPDTLRGVSRLAASAHPVGLCRRKKELIKGKFLTRHHQAGSALLALMVLGSLGGMSSTYINNGKLFFGPHLLVGLGMMGLIATSASMVPFMKKGNDTARYTHIIAKCGVGRSI